jgi:hypothetical protein
MHSTPAARNTVSYTHWQHTARSHHTRRAEQCLDGIGVMHGRRVRSADRRRRRGRGGRCVRCYAVSLVYQGGGGGQCAHHTLPSPHTAHTTHLCRRGLVVVLAREQSRRRHGQLTASACGESCTTHTRARTRPASVWRSALATRWRLRHTQPERARHTIKHHTAHTSRTCLVHAQLVLCERVPRDVQASVRAYEANNNITTYTLQHSTAHTTTTHVTHTATYRRTRSRNSPNVLVGDTTMSSVHSTLTIVSTSISQICVCGGGGERV